ncbi:DUF5405 family protein [Serratia fonticola]|uniref:DUF5405 family protein n=1 Tax=Serratia fonticola TaxID=47917 RepID=UPI003AF369CD
MDKQARLVQYPANRVIVGRYGIAKRNDGNFILSIVKEDKETGQTFYSTIAVYSDELNLIADVINFSVKYCVFIKSITNVGDLVRESNATAELCQSAFNQLNRGEGW